MKKRIKKAFSMCLATSVANKIKLGFAIVLVLHISIAGLGHYGLKKADDNRKEYEVLVSRVQQSYEIDRVVGELQRNVLLFVGGGLTGPESRSRELQNELEDLLVKAKVHGSTNDETLAEMSQHLSTHRDIFDAVVEDRGKQTQLIESDLAQCAIDFELSLESIRKVAPAELVHLDQAFQSAHLQCLQFARNLDSKHMQQLRADIDTIRQCIKHLAVYNSTADGDPQEMSELQEMSEVIRRFEEASILIQQATRGYLHLVNVVLAGETKDFLDLTASTRSKNTQRANSLATTMAADSARFQNASNLFSVVTIILGVAAAWIIQLSVAPPLKAIAKTFEMLANGETHTAIPCINRSDELGQLAAAAEVFRDKAAQTERLLIEIRKLREYERQIEHTDRLDSMGRLASGIAHEINTPMQCVASNIEFLEESYASLTQAIDQCLEWIEQPSDCRFESEIQLRELLASRSLKIARTQSLPATTETANAVRRVVSIIRAMKAMSHPGNAEKMPTDINQLIQDAATLTRNHWDKVATVELDLAAVPSIQVQPAELTQVLINLIVNASDSIAEVVQGDDRGRIRIASRISEENQLVLEISDSGAGIPEDIRGKIFDPFFTTKDVGKGTGQGLTITYDVIVKRHGGSIRVLPQKSGACIQLTLPMPKAEELKTTAVDHLVLAGC